MHDGANARAWVQVQVGSPTVVLPAGTPVLSRVPGLPATLEPASTEHDTARDASPVVFETVDEAVLHSDLNRLRFWTWGEQGCCCRPVPPPPPCAGTIPCCARATCWCWSRPSRRP